LKRNLKRFLLFFAAGIPLLVVSIMSYIYLASENYLKDVSMDQPFAYAGQVNEMVIAQGRHIARTRGCMGCHGQELEGLVFSDEGLWWGKVVAPNLARFARDHNAAIIERAVRQGIGQDDRALWSMPSFNFSLMKDEDLSALIAFLRSAPVVEKELPRQDVGWEARLLMARGKAQHMAEWADHMPALELGGADAPQLVRGEYLAKTTCNECHGFDLRGQSEGGPPVPDLAIVSAYTDEQFRHLMKTGEAIGGRTDLGLMSIVAKDRFAHFTDEELADLLAYLRTLASQPIDKEASWRALR